jgi:malate synthase
LLARAADGQKALDRGESFDFLPSTKSVRGGDWKVAPTPKDLQRRHVEITGPTERKMMINALNSGADIFMADFEDSLSPSWRNVVVGQQNCIDAVRRTISLETADKKYRLNEKTAVLLLRPRGWHLPEKHVTVDGNADQRQPLRLRALLLPQREGAPRSRDRSLLLPPEAGEPPRGAAVERGVRPSPRSP